MLAIRDAKLSIWMSHTNNDCAHKHTGFACFTPETLNLVANEAASKLLCVCGSCTTSETDVCARARCVPEGRGWTSSCQS